MYSCNEFRHLSIAYAVFDNHRLLQDTHTHNTHTHSDIHTHTLSTHTYTRTHTHKHTHAHSTHDIQTHIPTLSTLPLWFSHYLYKLFSGTYLDLAGSGGAAEGVGPGQCLSCHESCATCTGRTINECLTCPPGALLQNRSTCVQTCDTGEEEP